MAITAGGVGSGLDIEGIVSQLMYLERQPVRDLQSKNTQLDTRLSAFGKIKSALSKFETAMGQLGSLDKFKAFSATSSDANILTATASSSAAAGIYNIVVSNLAQNHKLGTASDLDSSQTFTGDLSITVAGTESILDVSGLTLAGIRDKINSDVDNPGVTATIINTGSGLQRLILTSDESGVANAVSVDESALSGALLGLTQTLNKDAAGTAITSSDLDAEYTIDGISLTASSNTISSVVDGITFSLKGIGSSTLSLEKDTEAVKTSIQGFVDAYNELWKTLDGLEKGDLASDSSVRSLKSTLRNVFNQAPVGLSGTFSALIQVGINSDARTGTLSLDSIDLENAINLDFDSVAELFANNDQGVAYRLGQLADNLTNPNGLIDSRQESIRSQVRYNENQVLSWEARLDLKEKAMRAKFSSLDALIGSMQSTSAFLANNLY